MPARVGRRRRTVGYLAVAALLCLACPLNAKGQDTPPPPWMLEASYTADGFAAVGSSGATNPGSTVSQLAHLSLLVEGDPVGWLGASLYLCGLWTSGPGPNDLVRTFQGVSNIEAPPALWLFEAWLEQELGNTGSLRAGVYDVNSEFDAIDAAGVFLNPSHGIGADFSQTGRNGPSIFPWTSLGVRLRLDPGPVTVQAAILDAVPGDGRGTPGTAIRLGWSEGALIVAEVSRSWNGVSRVALGAYGYTTPLRTLDGGSRVAGTLGAYLLGETALAPVGGLVPRGFLRLGAVDDRVNALGGYAGAGLVLESPRGAALGLAAAVALGGARFREMHRAHGHDVRGTETALELTWRLPLGRHLAVQPDVQYVLAPDLHAGRGNAVLLGLRLVASL